MVQFRKLGTSTILLLLFFLSCQPALLAVNLIYVSPTGNNTTGNGTISKPYLTIKKACQVALPSDTVFLLPGTFLLTGYDSFSPHGTENALITIKPYVANTVIFDGTNAPITPLESLVKFNGASYAVLEGIEVRNSIGRGIHVYESHHVTVRNCKVHDIDYRGIGGSGHYVTIDNNECYNCCMSNENQAFGQNGGWPGVISTTTFNTTGESCTNWIISNNSIHNCWGEGIVTGSLNGGIVRGNTISNVFSVSIYIDYGIHQIIENNYIYFNDPAYRRNGEYETDGIKWAVEFNTANLFPAYGVEDLIIRNNLIAGCRKAFSWYHEAPAAGPWLFYTFKDIKIYNNTCYGLTGSGLYLYANHANANIVSGCEFRNNIVGNDLYMPSIVGWTFSNNDWVSGIPPIGQHPNSIALNPQFVSPAIGASPVNFKLLVSSPCIDAGIPVSQVLTDFWGLERSFVSPAMGFYEYSLPVTWNGSISADWNNAGNWTPAGVPGQYHVVKIPGSTPNTCTVTGTNYYCKSLSVEAGGTLMVNISRQLTIKGTLILKNGSSLNNSGTIVLLGNLDNQNIP